MARKMQKMTALVLALALTASQVVLPALAEGTEDGTTITVTEQVTTDPATGSTTSTTNTTQSNPGAGVSSSNSVSTTTTTENLNNGGEKTTTDTQSEWSSTNTTNNTTTNTTGSQSSHHESTVDSEDRPLNESASLSGQESTTTTTTTSSNTTQEGKGTENKSEDSSESSNTETEPVSDSGTKEFPNEDADVSGLKTPEASITVSPDDKTVTETVKLTKEQIEQILESEKTPLNIPKPEEGAVETDNGFTYTTTTDDGKKQVVEITYIYGDKDDGLQDTIIGYKKTIKTTEGVEETTSSTTKSEHTTTIGEPNSGDGRNYQMPQRATEGTVTNEDGSTTVTKVEDQKNEAGELIGYKTVRTTTSADGKNTVVDTKTEYRTEINTSSNTTFTLPTRPSGGTVQNADGTTTVTTVEDIVEGGQVVGYKTTRVTTSSDGLYKYTETESIYGTTTTVDTQTTTANREESGSTETTTTKTVTTTTLIFYDAEGYQLVWDSQGNQWVYKATMSQVREDGKDMSSGADGGLDIVDETGATRSLLEPVYVIDGSGFVGKDLEERSTTTGTEHTDEKPDGYDYIYRGVRSLGSKYRVEASDGNYMAHLFELEKLDEDEKTIGTFYAYCVDMGTHALSNYYYKFENLEDAKHLDEGQQKHIKAIAMNGYWGTEAGTDTENPNLGSLAALRKKLVAKNVLSEEQAKLLTDGEAMTATQAAFWKYGNSGDSLTVNNSQSSGYHDYNYRTDKWGSNTEAGERINAVYQWLISLDSTEDDEPTQLIDKDSFATSATIDVKGAVMEGEGETAVKKYNTDITFTMNVKKSHLTGNLKLEIKEGNKVIKEVWIATDDSNLFGELLADENIVDTETGSTITIPDVVLGNGTKVTLTLSGAQKLKTGAYLYTSEVYGNESSQSFVTLAEGENQVALSVDLTLTVEEPSVQVQDPGRGEQVREKTTQVFEKVEQSNYSQAFVDTYEQVTTTSTTKRSWTAELLRSWEYEEPPKEEHPKGNDKDVPLAEAPKTGDNAWLWAVVCLGSLAGAMLLGKKKERA